eukprot:gene14511-18528_t
MAGMIQRFLKHRWLDEADTRRAIPRDLLERLRQRVAASEKRHSGEIRIYVEAGLPTSYLLRNATARERAVAMFGKLRVWDTEHNNGVLVYLLLAEHAIEIVADRGLGGAMAQRVEHADCVAQQVGEAEADLVGVEVGVPAGRAAIAAEPAAASAGIVGDPGRFPVFTVFHADRRHDERGYAAQVAQRF